MHGYDTIIMLCSHIHKWFYLIVCTLQQHNVAGRQRRCKERMLTYKTNIHLQILESYKMCINAPEFSSIFSTTSTEKQFACTSFLRWNGIALPEWNFVYCQEHIGIRVKLMEIGRAHARN